MSLTSLYLAPVAIDAEPRRTAVIRVLQDLEIIAGPLAPDLYLAGAGFPRHVIYAGCSPYLTMEPPADGSQLFCHVGIHGPWPGARLVTGPNTVQPRCPNCRGRFADWREHLSEWSKADAATQCPSCGNEIAPCLLDWREHAICGRLLVELRNVFPGEASPSDTLIDRLTQDTGMDWRYAWAAYLSD